MPGSSKKMYTPSELKTLRDRGVLSPSEVATMRGKSESLKSMRDKGVMSPSEVAARGYKYFPDNP